MFLFSNRDPRTQSVRAICEETWAILEPHFATRPHLVDSARQELAHCVDSLLAEGQRHPNILKNLACRSIQLKFGPAPARLE